MFKPNSGRKKANEVHKYYQYEASTDRSACNSCGTLIKGRNATNLLQHLRSKYKELAQECTQAEAERKGNLASSGTQTTIQVQCNVLFMFNSEVK